MTWFRLAWCAAFSILLGCSVSGCLPTGGSQLDEQKEPHFLEGRGLVSQMDFQGAIDAFEKAVEVNPRSASAHFELGCLYESDDPAASTCHDPAAAIYHYQRVLKLRPRSSEAELAREHINKCKLELARTVSALGPLPPSAQAEMDKILAENRDLKLQLARWEATYAAGRAPSITSNNAAPSVPANPIPAPAQQTRTVQQSRVTPTGSSTGANISATTVGTGRMHTVKSGEYPAVIARRYGVSVSALMAANPQAKPTHLQVGQVLKIPAS